MYRNFGLQTCKRGSKIAVLDTIHGAGTIAQRMIDLGMSASAFEVYHNTPCIEGFDLIVSPVHLEPQNPAIVNAVRRGLKIITHHQAVGEIVHPNQSVFEVTGTHSKTSTALLLAKILSSEAKVVSHTTRGIDLWSRGLSSQLSSGLSITPGNVIHAVRAADDQHADILVCEVSLGGTGLADYGIITSFSGDYRIAKGSKWASTAKLQMVSLAKVGSKLVANSDVRISSDISFGRDGHVKATRELLCFGKEAIGLDLSLDLDFPGYETAISAASSACLAAGLSKETIGECLEGFDGFAGRMKLLHEEGLEIYDSSNSGLKVSDVGRALDRIMSASRGNRIGLVVGEESETVCEGMDIPRLIDLLRRRRDEIDLLVLVGERLAPMAAELRALKAPDQAKGFDLARTSDDIDRLLMCVKCFR
jgi:coenzyme F430 synthetase